MENNKNFLRITQLVTEIDMLTMTLSNADGDALWGASINHVGEGIRRNQIFFGGGGGARTWRN